MSISTFPKLTHFPPLLWNFQKQPTFFMHQFSKVYTISIFPTISQVELLVDRLLGIKLERSRLDKSDMYFSASSELWKRCTQAPLGALVVQENDDDARNKGDCLRLSKFRSTSSKPHRRGQQFQPTLVLKKKPNVYLLSKHDQCKLR